MRSVLFTAIVTKNANCSKHLVFLSFRNILHEYVLLGKSQATLKASFATILPGPGIAIILSGEWIKKLFELLSLFTCSQNDFPITHTNQLHSFPVDSSEIQLSSTMSRTRLLYSRLSRSYNCDASAFAGDAGLGSLSND